MTAYRKVAGTWLPAVRPFVKRDGIWVGARAGYAKFLGAWDPFYLFDTTPPNAPIVSLSLEQTNIPGFDFTISVIKVGAQMPGVDNDEDVKMIRVMISDQAPPATQFGRNGYVPLADTTFSQEPWSDWYYNNTNPISDHGSTATEDFKFYPGPTSSFMTPGAPFVAASPFIGGKTWFVTAWAVDLDDNWSVGSTVSIWVPGLLGAVTPNFTIQKSSFFRANTAGSLDTTGAIFTEGDPMARETPRSNGVWFYGTKMTQAVGEDFLPTVTSAFIRLSRTNDSGGPDATVRVYWHGDGSTADLPQAQADHQDITVLGTIQKNETKWFALPSTWYTKFNTQIKSIGVRYGSLSTDFAVYKGLATDIRCGEVYLTWSEAGDGTTPTGGSGGVTGGSDGL